MSRERLQEYIKLHPNQRRADLGKSIARMRKEKQALVANRVYQAAPAAVQSVWLRVKMLDLLTQKEREYNTMITQLEASTAFRTWCASREETAVKLRSARLTTVSVVATKPIVTAIAAPPALVLTQAPSTRASIAAPARAQSRVWKDDSLPDRDLMTPVPINSLQNLDPLFEETIYLLLDRDRVKEVSGALTSAGAYITKHGLGAVKRNSPIDFEVLDPYLPLGARRAPVPVIGDLIPPSSFGSNLHKLLTPASWQALREETHATNGFRCEMCGSGKDLECHELWEYFEPVVDDGCPGVQRLQRLMSLCKSCHCTHHLGWQAERDRKEGRQFWYPRAIERLAAVNRWHEEDARHYDAEFLCPRCARRTEFDWALDVSVIARPERVLVVRSSWTYLQEHDNLVNEADGEDDVSSSTRLMGAPWKFAQGPMAKREFLTDPKAYYVGSAKAPA